MIDKKTRVLNLFDDIKKFLYNDNFTYLVKSFDGKTNFDDLFEYIVYLNDFVSIWDFRNKKERWNIEYTKFENEEEILDSFRKLGFIKKTKPKNIPKYVLPLGGARFANYNRVLFSKELIDELNVKNSFVISLSTFRLISDVEKEAVNTYAEDAITEFDAISRSLEKIYSVKTYEEEKNDNENINLCSNIRTYKEYYKDNKIISLSSFSSDPLRRANTRDTFLFFMDNININKNDNVLLVTSQIYTLYQYFSLIDIAIDNSFNLECVGTEMDIKNNPNVKLYFQELKGTINAIYKLYKKYEDILIESE